MLPKKKKTAVRILAIILFVCALAAIILLFSGLNNEELTDTLGIASLGPFAVMLGCFFAVLIIVSSNKIKEISYAKQRKSEHLLYHVNAIHSYENELSKVREKFISDTNDEKNVFEKGIQRNGQFSALYDFNVIKTGKIYYGCFVKANKLLLDQANKLLFMDTAKIPPLPGVIVYSQDPHFEKNPLDLIPIASCLLENKNSNILRFETEFFTNIELPAKPIDGKDLYMTKGKKVYMTTIFFNKEHLPTHKLCGKIFPVIADPLNSTSVFVVDEKYWTEDLIANFVHDNFKNE